MRKRIVTIGLVVVVVLVVLIGLTKFLDRKNNSRGVCNQFMVDLHDDDAKSSYALFSTNAQSNQTSASWQASVSQVKQTYTASPVYLSKQTLGSGTSAEDLVNYTVNTTTGSSNIKCYAVKQGSSWRVEAFLSSPAGS